MLFPLDNCARELKIDKQDIVRVFIFEGLNFRSLNR